MRVEVQGFFVLEDGRPRQPATNRFIQVLQAGLVHGKEDQRIAKEARGVAAIFEYGGGCGLRLAVRPAAVRVVSSQHHQTGLHVVGDISAGLRHCMDALEVACGAQVGTQPLLDLGHYWRGIAPELIGPVFRQLGDSRLR